MQSISNRESFKVDWNSSVENTNEQMNQAKTPNFLFGEPKTRKSSKNSSLIGNSVLSHAIQSDTSAQQSPMPSYRNPLSNVSRSVHWSPAMVRESQHSARSTTSPGPPLRLLRDEITCSPVIPINKSVTGSVINDRQADGSLSEIESNKSKNCHWVTIFGFSPVDASKILGYFGRHGTVVSHRVPKNGNWLHVCYASSIHATQALGYNGRIFENRLKLGVVLADAEECMKLESPGGFSRSSSDENRSLSFSSNVQDSLCGIAPSEALNYLDSSKIPKCLPPDGSRTLRPGIRSLRAAYNVADNEYRINNLMQPRKSIGFMDKLWSLIY